MEANLTRPARDIVINYFQAWKAQDTTLLRQILAPDVEYLGGVSGFDEFEPLAAYLKDLLSDDATVQLLETVASGNDAILLYNYLGSPGATDIRMAEYFHVEHGRIRKIISVSNAME